MYARLIAFAFGAVLLGLAYGSAQAGGCCEGGAKPSQPTHDTSMPSRPDNPGKPAATVTGGGGGIVRGEVCDTCTYGLERMLAAARTKGQNEYNRVLALVGKPNACKLYVEPWVRANPGRICDP